MRKDQTDHIACILVGSGLGTLIALVRPMEQGKLIPLFWVGFASLTLGLLIFVVLRKGNRFPGGGNHP